MEKSQNIMKMIVCGDFLMFFMSLITALTVKNSHIFAGIYFIFLKIVLKQTLKSFNTKFWPQWKD